MEKKQKATIVLFGPWVGETEKGEVVISEEGSVVEQWLSGKPITELGRSVDELERLLRQELNAQSHYRDTMVFELQLLRNGLLDEANAKVPDMSNPGATIVEAYNNGVTMGRHWKPVELAQKISDILDKYHMEKITDDDSETAKNV